jgi:hypothetical protein
MPASITITLGTNGALTIADTHESSLSSPLYVFEGDGVSFVNSSGSKQTISIVGGSSRLFGSNSIPIDDGGTSQQTVAKSVSSPGASSHSSYELACSGYPTVKLYVNTLCVSGGSSDFAGNDGGTSVTLCTNANVFFEATPSAGYNLEKVTVSSGLLKGIQKPLKLSSGLNGPYKVESTATGSYTLTDKGSVTDTSGNTISISVDTGTAGTNQEVPARR